MVNKYKKSEKRPWCWNLGYKMRSNCDLKKMIKYSLTKFSIYSIAAIVKIYVNVLLLLVYTKCILVNSRAKIRIDHCRIFSLYLIFLYVDPFN